MGFYPPMWGQYVWTSIHIFTLNYPVRPDAEKQRAARQFIESLAHLLPCPNCRVHFLDLLQALPLTDEVLASKREFITWGRLAHNSVNRRLGKREWENEEFMEYYMNLLFNPDRAKEKIDSEQMKRDEEFKITKMSRQITELTGENAEQVNLTIAAKLETQNAEQRHRSHQRSQSISFAILFTIVSIMLIAIAVLAYFWGKRRGTTSYSDETANSQI